MHFSYLPDPPTVATELAGFKISVIVVAVLFEDLITGRLKLLLTTAVHKCECIQNSLNQKRHHL